MKTAEEINIFLSDKLFDLSDNYIISQFALAKGINVCTQFDNDINKEAINCSFKEFLEWFENETKELELIEREFYTYTEPNGNIWIYQYRKRTTKTSHFFALIISNDNLYKNGTIDGIKGEGIIKIATLQQKQLLIDKVKEKIGKIWDEETKTFEDKPKDILVPENIKIIKYQNNRLGLVFNNNKQVLTFSEKVYMVMPFDKLDKFVSCRFEKTSFKKLKAGEIFVSTDDKLQDLTAYHLRLEANKVSYISQDIMVHVFPIDIIGKKIDVYKVVPCQQ